MGTSTVSRLVQARRPWQASRGRTRRIVIVASVALVAAIGGLLNTGVNALEGAFGRSAFSGPLPACRIDDIGAPHATLADWGRTLLDPTYRLDRAYAPDDLVSTTEAGIAGVGSVRALVILDLEALSRAASRAGVTMGIESAYRSFDDQVRTFDSLARAYGIDFAQRSAARPGHSEHQLGTTIDFLGGEAWLADNAWRFGFVMSYPPARSPTFSCYKAEPWHFRYFGRARAATMRASGLSSREWLWQHADDRP
jgi:D-alanyl-D-alanine carboxypeptidase